MDRIFQGLALFAAAVCATTILFICSVVFAGHVSLKWDANKETDLAGYKVYKSRTGRYPFTYVGSTTATTYTLDNISTSLPNVFAVTAFNTMSSESVYSNRLKISVPRTRINARITGSVSGGF